MIRLGGVLFVLVLAVSLVLMPAAVFAASPDGRAGLSKCEWDPVKWEKADIPWNLYIKHWGRTPVSAMSHLAGLCGPDEICKSKWGLDSKADRYGCQTCECCACRDKEQGMLAGCDDPVNCTGSQCTLSCPAVKASAPCAGSSCTPCDKNATYDMAHCCCSWGVSLCFANKSWSSWSGDTLNKPRFFDSHMNHRGTSVCYGGGTGGDWGSTGCAHTECCVQTWCLTDNLAPSPQLPAK